MATIKRVKDAPEPEKKQAEYGIIKPTPELLPIDSNIYRFTNRMTTFGFDYRAGAWWIRQTDFDRIMQRARRDGMELGQKARWDLAVLEKWSPMDLVLQAKVTDRLWAWTGYAKQQNDTTPQGRIIRLHGHREIRQLYLIGVVDPVVRVGIASGRDNQPQGRVLTQWGRHCLSLTGAKAIPASRY